jgi:predicted PurR-regulated permease PerM
MDIPSPPSRSRVAWWLFVGVLAFVVAYVFLSFLGTVALGIFIYYATRPAFRHIHRRVNHRGLAAALTMFTVAIPGIATVGWVLLQALQELGPTLITYESLIDPYLDFSAFREDPWQTVLALVQDPESASFRDTISTAIAYLRTLATAVTHLFLAITLSYYLLRDQHRIRAWFEGEAGGRDTAAYVYAASVDKDLETIYFSNVLLVGLVAVLSFLTYQAYNLLAPAAITIPFPTALAFATGLTSLVPLVVGKVVYVPLTAYLASVAAQMPEVSLAYPVVLFVHCLVFLDVIPMTFLLPKIAGRETHVGLVMFGYIVGTMLFGWYGLFLGPLIIVLVVQAIRIVLSDLIHGDPVTTKVKAAESLGSSPDR